SVASRVAQKARVDAARRRKYEGRAAAAPVSDPLAEVTLRETQELLDRELARLPDKFRAPLVLCYLEGLTRDEAAARLGWPVSTLKSRLEQARERLRLRLASRGLALSAALVASLFHDGTAPAAIPSVLLDAIAKAAPAGIVSARAAVLADGVVQAMFLMKAKLAMVVLLATGVFAGAALWAYQGSPAPSAGQPPVPASQPRDQASAKDKPAETFTYKGRVLGPDGKPFTGAQLYLVLP